MKKILFKRTNKAFLPEISAYIKYFNKTKYFQAFDSNNITNYSLNDFDVIWEFKGLGGFKKDKHIILIHEYASLSTGRFPRIKNIIKSKSNFKPDLRIFLNENVKNGFSFNDNIEYCYRDMGIGDEFFKFRSSSLDNKEYDYVYVGSISKDRGIDKLLKAFNSSPNGKICLIGNVEDSIYKEYKNNRDIIFTGVVPYIEVPKIASKAIYGINFIPNKYPFNIQTSTKLLEYLTLNLKIITTDYKWVRDFEKINNCSFYKVNNYNVTIDKRELQNFDFINKFDAENYTWDKIIDRSKILDKLEIIFDL